MKRYIFTLLAMFLFTGKSFSQNCNLMNIQWQTDIPSTCQFMTMTMIHDVNNLPYLYVANKEGGLLVYDITNIASPSLSATVATTLFDTLDVMNVSQSGNYLYLAIGNSFTNPTKGGMAILDISTPASPVVTDYYIVPNSNSGGGIVRVEGDFAYLGAMQSGLIILDVTDKTDIQFVSEFIPDINFPPVANPNPQLYNARGMEVKNSIVYLCYDAGGIRIVNCTDKFFPVETGRWCNPAMYNPINQPKAYNNCILDDTLLYVAVDYAGMEVLNVSDTANITMTGWWNPYNAPNNNWFSSPVHSNEIQYEKNCNRIFLSTGKSDMYVIDVSNPSLPDSCNFYGGVSNNLGTWGIGIWQNQIYLSYICAVIPFSSNWTGVKILTYNSCVTGIGEQQNETSIAIYPNPVLSESTLKTNRELNNATLTVYNSCGLVQTEIKNISGNSVKFNRDKLAAGIYFFRLSEDQEIITTEKLVIAD